MLNPLSTATAIILAIAVGGLAYLARPLDDGVVPAAQAQISAPVPFSATFGSGPAGQPESTVDTPGVGTRSTGGTWTWSQVQEATDERLRGTTTVYRNHDSYRGDGSALDVNYSMIRIENEAGAWQSQPVLYVASPFGPSFPVAFIGEGDYDGLYAIGTLTRPSGFWELEGYIFEGQPLPPPEPDVSQ